MFNVVDMTEYRSLAVRFSMGKLVRIMHPFENKSRCQQTDQVICMIGGPHICCRKIRDKRYLFMQIITYDPGEKESEGRRSLLAPILSLQLDPVTTAAPGTRSPAKELVRGLA